MSTNTETKKMPAAAARWVNGFLLVAWALLLVFLAQNAVASQTELEPRAAMVFWASFAVALIAGAIIAGVRTMRRPRA